MYDNETEKALIATSRRLAAAMGTSVADAYDALTDAISRDVAKQLLDITEKGIPPTPPGSVRDDE